MNAVLIADDDQDIVDLLRCHCTDLGLSVLTANNAQTAEEIIHDRLPDLAILDVDMPGGGGLHLSERLLDEGYHLPMIMLTGSRAEDTIRRCHSACLYYVLKCPDIWNEVAPLLTELLGITNNDDLKPSESSDDASENFVNAVAEANVVDTVFALLGMETDGDADNEAGNQSENQRRDDESAPLASYENQPWILSVEDDPDFALALQVRLQQQGYQVMRASAGTEGYRRAFVDAPHAILLDYELPNGDGAYVLRRLKECPVTNSIPVIMITGRGEAYIRRQAFSLGAERFLTKPLNWVELQRCLEELHANSVTQ